MLAQNLRFSRARAAGNCPNCPAECTRNVNTNIIKYLQTGQLAGQFKDSQDSYYIVASNLTPLYNNTHKRLRCFGA